MTFAPENDLERALVAAAADETRRPNSTTGCSPPSCSSSAIVVPAPDAGGQEMRLVAARNGARDYHLVFSSLSRCAISPRRISLRAHPRRELFGNVQGPWFYLNPGVEYGRELPPDELARMMASRPPARRPQTKATAVTLDAPTEIMVVSCLPAILPRWSTRSARSFDARATCSRHT
jgi:hypothetical protein